MLFRFLLAATILLCAPAATWGDEDPPGTEQVTLLLHGTKALKIALQGTTAVCDDPSIAAPETTEEGPVLRGLSLGTTLCGLRGALGQQLGLLRVTVVPPPKPKQQAPKRNPKAENPNADLPSDSNTTP